MRRFPSLLMLILCLAVAAPAFADVIVGLPPDPGTGNCFPFGCAYNAEYQQVYNSGQFSGPITIKGLEFFNTQFNSGATTMNSGTWTISLFTTPLDWNTIGSNYAANIAVSTGIQVFSGNLFQTWAFGDTLTINLQTAFSYDPSKGNLLMDVVCTGCSNPNGSIFFDTNGLFMPNTFMSRVYCPSGIACSDGVVSTGYGLVTGFITGTQQNTPEPASLMLFGTGILSAASVLRRKLRK